MVRGPGPTGRVEVGRDDTPRAHVQEVLRKRLAAGAGGTSMWRPGLPRGAESGKWGTSNPRQHWEKAHKSESFPGLRRGALACTAWGWRAQSGRMMAPLDFSAGADHRIQERCPSKTRLLSRKTREMRHCAGGARATARKRAIAPLFDRRGAGPSSWSVIRDPRVASGRDDIPHSWVQEVSQKSWQLAPAARRCGALVSPRAAESGKWGTSNPLL